MSRVCPRCGEARRDTDYLAAAPGSIYDGVCKFCVGNGWDARDLATAESVLREMDRPFVDSMWRKTVERWGTDPADVLGPYLRKFNLPQFKGCCYADSAKLNERYGDSVKDDAQSSYADMLAAKLAAGEITQADYDRMDPSASRRKVLGAREADRSASMEMLRRAEEAVTGVREPHTKTLAARKAAMDPSSPTQDDVLAATEAAAVSSLTEDDMVYLVSKWGAGRTVEDLLAMERMYRDYEAEYELNVDRREALVTMCKTSVRMDRALEDGNVADYQRLASVLKDLRTSAKFTDAQKADRPDKVDSVGRLVGWCERYGGVIPEYCDPDEFPRDQVDYTLAALKSYTYDLVVNEAGLGGLIETYVQRLEAAEGEDRGAMEYRVPAPGDSPDDWDEGDWGEDPSYVDLPLGGAPHAS